MSDRMLSHTGQRGPPTHVLIFLVSSFSPNSSNIFTPSHFGYPFRSWSNALQSTWSQRELTTAGPDTQLFKSRSFVQCLNSMVEKLCDLVITKFFSRRWVMGFIFCQASFNSFNLILLRDMNIFWERAYSIVSSTFERIRGTSLSTSTGYLSSIAPKPMVL